MKLRRLQSTLRQAPARTLRGIPSDVQRMTGRALQARRLRLWTDSPHCANCGQLTDYPQGFELDHIIRLADGGPDTDDNCQVLCVWYDDRGLKRGCHAEKTAAGE